MVTMVKRGVLLFAAVFLGFGAMPAGAAPLVSHFAIYDLKLDSVGANANIAGFAGRMVFDFQGSRCTGFTTRMRFVTDLGDDDGNSVVTDTRARTFESGDGKSFEFSNETYVDGELSGEAMGVAKLNGASAEVALIKPEQATVPIARPVLFPTGHLDAILEAARAGQSFVAVDMYDGAETGRIVYATSAVIAPVRPGRAGSDAGEIRAAGFADMKSWRVTVAYFTDEEGEPGTTPDYTLSFTLYDNGIARDLRLDYGEFVAVGHLVKLTVLKGAACP